MSSIDVSKIIKNAVSLSSEQRIEAYKNLYRKYPKSLRRSDALTELTPLIKEFQTLNPTTPILRNEEEITLIKNAEFVVGKYFGDEILQVFKKKIDVKPSNIASDGSPKWLQFLSIISSSIEATNEAYKHEWAHRREFIITLYKCLKDYGLHDEIQKRDNSAKRYNVVVRHNFKSKSEIVDTRILLAKELLQDSVIAPFERKLPIMIQGKLIPFKSIHSIQISSTLLKDDEIDLFARKYNFSWGESSKDHLSFTNKCKDETDDFLRNPFLIADNGSFKNGGSHFISLDRLKEIKKIKSDKFELDKLIRILEELNTAASSKNFLSVSLLLRGLVDHVPPIFGFQNFSEVANNYRGGTMSFRRSMVTLDKSMRNIADNHIHSQIRQKEVLPTLNQVDFTQDIDLLLSEIVRILK